MNVSYINPADAQRRASLRKMQQPRSTRIVRRVLIAIVALFAVFTFLFAMAAFNPWFHRNDLKVVHSVCLRGMT